MARIALAGFLHETNSFAPTRATWEEFLTPRGHPGLTRGQDIPGLFDGVNIGLSGALKELGWLGHDTVPLLWCSAVPSAEVTDQAFERISALIVAGLVDAAAQGAIDGVYLDLHGAAAVDSFEDAEGELLRRVRAAIGPAVPLVASLDLHANVTLGMVAAADALVAYRTYPHIDMADTGKRAATVLDRLVRGQGPRHKAYRQLDFLIPINWQCTSIEPCRSIYQALEDIERETGAVLSFTPGFPATDIADCGPAVFAFADDEATADAAAGRLADLVRGFEAAFAGKLWDPDEAVQYAMGQGAGHGKPVVLADTQDNPGAGGNSDTVGLLDALIRHDADGAVLAILFDPEAAQAAHEAGEGRTLQLKIGARSRLPGHQPLDLSVEVERLGDGRFVGTGPMYGGANINIGPMALLKVLNGGGGVRVIVGSRKMQAADQAIFRHLGVEPINQRILALKSSVHFRADFEPVASEVLVVRAPGAMAADPADLPFTRLRPGVRINPLGKPFSPPA